MTIPDLTLTELSELLSLLDADAILRELASRGCIIPLADEGWSPVADGMEYLRPEIDPVRVDGILCRLIAELSRAVAEPGRMWLGAFELFPSDDDGASWSAAIRSALLGAFELSPTSGGEAEIFQRGAIEEAILLPASSTSSPHLLLHLRPQLRE